MLFWAVAVQRILHEAGMFVVFGLNMWDHSFLPSFVYCIHLQRLPFCFSLALKESIWGLYHIFAWNCHLALQRELVNVCTVLYTREVGGEVGLARCESDHRLSGLGRIPVGSGARSPSEWLPGQSEHCLGKKKNLLNRWIFKGVPNCILDKCGL